LNALIPLYMGKQVVVVGDHEQVTPLGVGKDQTMLENLRKSMLQDIPNSHLFDNLSSIYDIGRQSFGDAIRLVEHFRCVPEIIAFSNQLSYEGKIQPLREANSTKLKPACIARRVHGIREKDVNHGEAEDIIATIKAMTRHPAYAGKTMGVISLKGNEQAVLIQTMLHKELDTIELESRRIQAGISGEFQGDERDIIFLSMVDSLADEGTLRATGAGAFEQTKKRYNVAASRARDQLWVMHSFDPDLNLKSSDLRFQLLRHVKDPQATLRAFDKEERRTESPFEREVLKLLTSAGYLVRTQWQVGYFRIDMVVEGGGKRLAIECDGDRWHPLEKLAEDIERQTILERLGWQFVRVRGTAFYRNPDLSMQPVFARLADLEIPQEAFTPPAGPTADMTLVHELDKIIARGFGDDEPAEAQARTDAHAAVVNDPLALPPVTSPDFNHGQLEASLSRKGGVAQVDTFLREVAAAAGHQRLGKNIRAGLEAELTKLQCKGKISLSGGMIRLLRQSPPTLKPELLNAARGAIFGALIGDAAGATLEFLGRKPTQDEVQEAMKMVGGGVWKTAPGQVTDDGELTLALASALAGKTQYSPDLVALSYRKWFLSAPFDKGNATSHALGSGDVNSPNLARIVMENARQGNLESKANGSLMRASALAVWSSGISIDQAVISAKLDAQLTHPNPVCQWADVAYVLGIRHLLLNSGDAEGAFNSAKDALSSPGAQEVRGWLEDARCRKLPAFYPQAGFVRIGFTHAFYHLLNKTPYTNAISLTLSEGGDTDTNACVVGGLVGALHGASSIPSAMIDSILSCDTRQGRARPAWLHTTQIDGLIPRLLVAG